MNPLTSGRADLLAAGLVSDRLETTVGTLAALSLATVLAVAAVAKLRNPDSTAREFAQLGLPGPGQLARLVPVAELVAAASLVVRPMVGALVSGLLLVSFSLVLLEILQNRDPGSEIPSCSCFGSLSRRPVSAITVVRNVGLLTLAGLAAMTPSLAMPDLASLIVVSIVALVLAVAGHLAWMRSRLGLLWSVELAGEPAGSESRTVVSEVQQ